MVWNTGARAVPRASKSSYPTYDMQYLSNALGNAGIGTKYDRGGLEGVNELVYTQKAAAGFRREAKSALHNEFSLWLQGKHIDNTEMNAYDNTRNGVVERRHFMDGAVGPKDNWKPTWWGKSQLTHLPGVRQYLIDSKMASERETMDLNKLAELGPQNLDDAWAYFKTWVKGMPVSEAVNFNHSTTNDFDRSLFGPKMPSQMMENNPMDEEASMDSDDRGTMPNEAGGYTEFKPYIGKSKPSNYETAEESDLKHQLQQKQERARIAQLKRDADKQAASEEAAEEAAAEAAASVKAARAYARQDKNTKAAEDAENKLDARAEVRRVEEAAELETLETRRQEEHAAAVATEARVYAALRQRQEEFDAENAAKAVAADDARRKQEDEHNSQLEYQQNQIVLAEQANETSILAQRLTDLQQQRLLDQSQKESAAKRAELAFAAITQRDEIVASAEAYQATIQLEALRAFSNYRLEAEKRQYDQALLLATSNEAEFNRINAMTFELLQSERHFQSTLASNFHLNQTRENYVRMVEYYAGEYVRQQTLMANSMERLRYDYDRATDRDTKDNLLITMKEQDKSDNVILLGFRQDAQLETRKLLEDFSREQVTTMTIYEEEKVRAAASNTAVQEFQSALDGPSAMDTGGPSATDTGERKKFEFIQAAKVDQYYDQVIDMIKSEKSSDSKLTSDETLNMNLRWNDSTTELIIEQIKSSNASPEHKVAMIEKLREAQTLYTKSITKKRMRLKNEVIKVVRTMATRNNTQPNGKVKPTIAKSNQLVVR